MYAIASRTKQQRAELKESEEGIQLILCREGQQSPYYSGLLNDMLTYSSGKPWNSDHVGLQDVQISSPDEDANNDTNNRRILISGTLAALHFTMELSFDESDTLKMYVTWTNTLNHTLHDVAVGIGFSLPKREKEIITIPGILYNNNPSSDPNRLVPRLGVGAHKGVICEEHRLPIPCVNIEWNEADESRYLSMFSIPTYVEDLHGAVHYGSLGAIQEDQRSVLAAMSGVLMFNGDKDICYMGKSKSEPHSGGYLDFVPGFTLAKEYTLDWGTLSTPGRGFREIVRQGMKIFNLDGSKPLTLDEVIKLKTNAMDDRWRTNEEGAAGYVKFNDSNSFGNVSKRPLHYMYGWTGQCLKLAWCDAQQGFVQGQEERISRCIQAVDFYLRESRTEIPGIRRCAYRIEDGQWDDFSWNKQPVIASRAIGETIADLAEIVLLFRDQDRAIPASWVEAIRESADFYLLNTLSSGIFPAAWLMDGTPADEMITAAGVPCLIALVKAYRVLGDESYLAAAEAAMKNYYELHAETFERPFARSTLDAKCEDKEAGMYFFLAAYELFILTSKQQYSEWAEISADWLLTFVYMWKPAYDKGSRFEETDFNAIGWPTVSVQNHHLDVFFPTYELWKFGRLTGKLQYERMAQLSFDAMGQGICREPGDWNFTVVGEQGEGFFQTRWHHRGHSNKWNPSWVIATVLHNALRFQGEIG
ncbi:hypothetical protein GC093_26945 [Paenibacillus sp. LMG 31456]|uniref:Uncharacterized protein n=1 Tax=Paenibacillus foliorum TaxID=2654974 RepID=A0A972K2K2_9BACL|nr:hypothetical protein [Paenibacillus foliorum]